MIAEDEADIQEGRDAVAVESIVGPYVNEHIAKKITSLVNFYRSGELDGAMAVSVVAEISAMRGLMEELENKQRLGYLAAQREYEYGTKEEDPPISYDE